MLIVEDGTGLSNADSYASLAEANLYHANHGNVDWSDIDATTKEQLLRKATDYMVAQYRLQYAFQSCLCGSKRVNVQFQLAH